MKASVTGAINGAVGAIIGGGLHAFGDWAGSALAGGSSPVGTVAHVAAHGATGGAMAEANGGSFRDGFIGGIAGAGITGLAGKVFGGTNLYNPDSASYGSVASIAGRTAIASVAGGLSSMATGGKFADGAYSAAFFHLFNNEAGLIDKAKEAYKNLRSFLDGNGESVQYFGDGSVMSDGMKSSLGVSLMRDEFYASGNQRIGKQRYQWTNSPTGLWRIFRAGLDGVEQQVGSWHGGSVTRYGDTLLFMIENPISNESLYRPWTDFKSWIGINCILGSSPQNVFTGPHHNVTQIIWWTEKYNPPVRAAPAQIDTIRGSIYGGY